MLAIDTNVVLRYALRGDPAQAILATDFLRENRCLLLPTVRLEAAWVMGSKRGYGLDPSAVAERLRHVAGLPTVEVEQASRVAQALDWYEAGMDFADALHLALAGPVVGIATMDQGIQVMAARLKLPDRVVLLSRTVEHGR
jgi:predicted nucleic acid-binding protein